MFHKCISSKMDVIAWLEFELAYFEVAVQYVINNSTKTPPSISLNKKIDFWDNLFLL